MRPTLMKFINNKVVYMSLISGIRSMHIPMRMFSGEVVVMMGKHLGIHPRPSTPGGQSSRHCQGTESGQSNAKPKLSA